MKTVILVALCAILAACGGPERAATGTSVRAIMASQVIPAQPAKATGTDAAAAVAAQQNYLRSYVSPVPQGDNASFGTSVSK
jgi:hypothetical protein